MKEYPNLKVFTYSRPNKTEFTIEDNEKMIASVNSCSPEVLFIGYDSSKAGKMGIPKF